MAGERVLVVEDDRAIGEGLTQALVDAEYDASLVGTGGAALDTLDREWPDLVLLDLGLPDIDGLELCRSIRALSPDIRIIMLTARTEEIDIVVGLDAGADDYLTKPFRLAELLARLRAHLRRPSATSPGVISVGDLTVDVGARRVFRGEEEIELSPKEFDLLVLLLEHTGQAVTREQIMVEVWDEHWFGSTKTLDMHMSTLRRKIGDDDQTLIATIRGVGYRFEGD